jgi:uncharacterized protein YlxW (UPF0749 family)
MILADRGPGVIGLIVALIFVVLFIAPTVLISLAWWISARDRKEREAADLAAMARNEEVLTDIRRLVMQFQDKETTLEREVRRLARELAEIRERKA